MKKKILAVVMVVMILSMSFGFALTPGEYLHQRNIIKGTDKGLEEGKYLTREELVTILSRIIPNEQLAGWEFDGDSGFDDVPNDHWAAAYIKFAKERNITNGIGNNKFGLGQKVTGRQAIVFLAKIMNVENAGSYFGLDGNISEKIEADSGIALDKIPPEKYDKNIIRHDVFSLLFRALSQKPIGTDETLAQHLFIFMPLPEVDYDKTFETVELNETTEVDTKEVFTTKIGDVGVKLQDTNSEQDNLLLLYNKTNNEIVDGLGYSSANILRTHFDYDNVTTYGGALQIVKDGLVYSLALAYMATGSNEKDLIIIEADNHTDNSLSVKLDNGKVLKVGDPATKLDEVFDSSLKATKANLNWDSELTGDTNVVYKIKGLNNSTEYGIRFSVDDKTQKIERISTNYYEKALGL